MPSGFIWNNWTSKEVVRIESLAVFLALDQTPAQLVSSFIALGFISDSDSANLEAEISVVIMPSKKSAMRMELWTKFYPFIDYVELFLEYNIQNWICTWIFVFLSYDQSGQFLIIRAMEGYIFILDARPSKLFQVLGYVGNTCNNINYMFSLFVVF